MKSHLKYTTEDYFQEADARGVRPISEIDGEIITMLIQGLKTHDERLSKILDQWKNLPDDKVLKMVQDHVAGRDISVEEEYEGEEGYDDDMSYRDFVTIKGQSFQIMNIISIGRAQSYTSSEGLQFYIVINKGPLPAKHGFYEDTYIGFGSERKRDEQINKLKQKMKTYGIKFI